MEKAGNVIATDVMTQHPRDELDMVEESDDVQIVAMLPCQQEFLVELQYDEGYQDEVQECDRHPLVHLSTQPERIPLDEHRELCKLYTKEACGCYLREPILLTQALELDWETPAEEMAE